MKRYSPGLIAGSIALVFFSCNNGNNASSTSNDSTSSSATTSTDSSTKMNTDTTTHSTASTAMTLSREDSTFVMKAAAGGMMEVDLGNVAQQNAVSGRVKNFGQMMVTDHSKANDELKSLASSKGMTLPSSLPDKEKKHVDMMKKMTGKSFDDHYIGMMVTDHKEDIAEFEKASKNVKDPDIKNWATKTLPTLKTHLDSAQAINKHKM